MGVSAASPRHSLVGIAKALADERRAEIAVTLMDGRAWTPVELAARHRWPRSSVTEHLNVLMGAGLIVEVRQGRHRYVRLAGADVAELIEGLSAFVPSDEPGVSSLSGTRNAERLRAARTCYDHFAGRFGVQLRDGLLRLGVVDRTAGYTVTPEGVDWFDALGFPLLRRGASDRRPLVRACLDWTERVDHVAGVVADTLCGALIQSGWVARRNGSRAVWVTPSGVTALPALGLLDVESAEQLCR